MDIVSVEEDMRELVASFYERLFTFDGLVGANVLLQNIVPLVTADMNQRLTAAFSDDEIERANSPEWLLVQTD